MRLLKRHIILATGWVTIFSLVAAVLCAQQENDSVEIDSLYQQNFQAHFRDYQLANEYQHKADSLSAIFSNNEALRKVSQQITADILSKERPLNRNDSNQLAVIVEIHKQWSAREPKAPLAKAVKKNRQQYENIRQASLQIEAKEKAGIEKAFKNLKELYPKTIFPDVYFVMGRMNAGGIAQENRVIIGYELSSVIGQASILPLIVHETIHTLQNHPITESNLLSQCIIEGAADFVSELAIGNNGQFNHHNDAFGLPNEQALWRQFKKDMDNKSFGNWLYGGQVMKGSPEHMGYWLGYQIVKAYFLKKNDTQAAVAEILNITDFSQFLKNSGYAEKFK
ncbi:MAG: DUF2268 domain-containing putative Zn-dependent protease [Bacteroidota bacterium]